MARGDAALIHLSNIALSPEIMKTITCITIVICAMSVATSSLAQTVSLDSCRRMALRTNKSIRMADEAVQGAGYSRKAAQAAYLPGIDAGATYMYNQHKTSLLSEDAKLPTMYFNPLTGKYDYDVVLGLDGKPVINPENGMPIPEVVAVIPKDALTFDTRSVFAGAITLTQRRSSCRDTQQCLAGGDLQCRPSILDRGVAACQTETRRKLRKPC